MQKLLTFILLIVSHAVSAEVLSNVLAQNPSPYLAMHGQDPVAWQTWDEQTVQRARKENKLLFVSIGYFSCHWCHVMQQESYQNPAIADLLNKHFIPVKVDRELTPALDATLIRFVEQTRGYSGWPLNVFVTPDGYPLVGIVYLPPADFQALIEKLSASWQDDNAGLSAMARQAAAELSDNSGRQTGSLQAGAGKRYQQSLQKQALLLADQTSGGFGEQSKFPQVPQLQALLNSYRMQGGSETKQFLQLTLDAMMRLGLHDLIGGGFYRYTVDPAWHIPHFEKMLYDNALLADLYLQAGQVLQEPRYTRQAYSTLDFMLSVMAANEGAFIASLSAVDDQNVEGGYYLFDDDMLNKLLTQDELRVARLAWGMTAAPELDAGHLPIMVIPNKQVAEQLGLSMTEVRKLVASARTRLNSARSKRVLPRDDKLLAGWNGLALVALARAAQTEPRYRQAADRLRHYLVNTLWTGESLVRARNQQGPYGTAGLEDYAYVAAGLLAYAELTGRQQDYVLTRKILQQGWQRFYGPGGWRLSESRLLAYSDSEAMIADGPLPSPSAVMIDSSLKVAGKTADQPLRQRAVAAMAAGAETLQAEPFWYASHLDVLARWQAGG
jgi:hypothetical protein